jgi:predicted membrane-bound mannosyltransferase
MWQKRRDVGSLISASSLLQQAFIMGVFFCAVVVLLYTWGGRHWQGLSDLVHSVPHSMSRAAGQGHEKPFAYYFGLLAGGWSGAPMLALATVGLANSFGTRRRFAVSETVAAETGAQEWFSFVAIYGLAIAVIYSAIPYKTPWLALNLWLPLSLLAGRGVSVIWEAAGRTAAKFSFAVALVFLAGALGRDSWQRAFVHPGGVGNPFAYAHTSEGFLDLPDRMAQLARERNLNDQIRIAVVATDPWPLPWYLRRFPQTGFWQPDQDPGVQDCYITMVDLPEPLRSRLEHWRPEFFELRPEVLVILWTLPPEDRP